MSIFEGQRHRCRVLMFFSIDLIKKMLSHTTKLLISNVQSTINSKAQTEMKRVWKLDQSLREPRQVFNGRVEI